MPVPSEVIWSRDPHTEAKHLVLSGYYDAWYPIMLSKWPRLTVFDGYAGPGEYSAGEEGSPIVALRRLVDRPELVALGKPVRFIFVEERGDRLDHLRSLIAAKFPRLPGNIRVDLVRGSCETVWDTALTSAGAWGQPIFANLDPFGPGVPYPLIERLGRNRASEVLVTFMSDWLRRFATLAELDDGDIQFGNGEWRQVADLGDPESKELYLVTEYLHTLARAGLGLTARFRLSDEGGRSFYLIYGTGHPRGLEKMKESMWKIDPVRGIRFRDPSDPEQGVLDLGQSQPDLSPLKRQLRKLLAGNQPNGLTLEELRQYALRQTAFRPPHATRAVRQMIAAGDLRRDPVAGQLSGSVRLGLA